MWPTMMIALRTAFVTFALTGMVYPSMITVMAQALFPHRANGSLVTDEHGQIVGSELIGQGFMRSAYFQPRPSAAGENGYDAMASSGSNLGPTAQKLQERVRRDLTRLQEENPDARGPVPVELVTTSGSGLDPHLSPEAVRWQIPRVALARGVVPERIALIVDNAIEARDLGILGEPRVNILLLNLALDRQFGRPHSK